MSKKNSAAVVPVPQEDQNTGTASAVVPVPQDNPKADELEKTALQALSRLTELSSDVLNNGEYFPIGDGSPLSGQALDQWIIRSEQDQSLRMVGRGVAYLLKQRELPNNAFNGWLNDVGLDRSNVYKCIKVAKMYASLSDEAVKQVPSMEFHKLASLSRLPMNFVEELATSGRLDDLQSLTRKQFVDELNTLKKTKAQLEKAEKRIEQLESERSTITAPVNEGVYPTSVINARSEGAAMGKLIVDAVARLEQLEMPLRNRKGLSVDPNLQREQLRAGLGPIIAAANAANARLQQLIMDLAEYDPEFLPGTNDPVLLTPAESLAALERFELMMATAAKAGA